MHDATNVYNEFQKQFSNPHSDNNNNTNSMNTMNVKPIDPLPSFSHHTGDVFNIALGHDPNTTNTYHPAHDVRSELHIFSTEMKSHMNLHRQLLQKREGQLQLHHSSNNNNNTSINVRQGSSFPSSSLVTADASSVTGYTTINSNSSLTLDYPNPNLTDRTTNNPTLTNNNNSNNNNNASSNYITLKQQIPGNYNYYPPSMASTTSSCITDSEVPSPLDIAIGDLAAIVRSNQNNGLVMASDDKRYIADNDNMTDWEYGNNAPLGNGISNNNNINNQYNNKYNTSRKNSCTNSQYSANNNNNNNNNNSEMEMVEFLDDLDENLFSFLLDQP